MTILNVWCSPDRAVVTVDTLGGGGHHGEEIFECSKMIALPHWNAVFAGRGTSTVLTAVVSIFNSFTGTFDEAADRMHEMLPQVIEAVAAQMIAQGAPVEKLHSGQDIVLVGPSVGEKRIVAMHHRLEPGATEWVLRPIDPWRLMPPATLTADRPDDPPSDQELLDIAQLQTTWHNEAFPLMGTGGRLLKAEITAEGMSIRSIGVLRPGGRPAA